MKLKVTDAIRRLFTVQPQWTTEAIMQTLAPLGFTKVEVSGGIGYLRSTRQLQITSKLAYGHRFA